jgi:hypothetical protein
LILLLTNGSDRTCPMVERHLAAAGDAFLRLDTESFGLSCRFDVELQGRGPRLRIRTPDREWDGDSVDAVWNRRPVLPTAAPDILDPEARRFASEELRALLDGALLALDCRWVSRPEAIRAASHKLYQLRLAHEHGFELPATLVSADPARIRGFCESLARSGRRAITKVAAQGPPRAEDLERQYSVFTHLLEPRDLEEDASLAAAPAMYQEYVEKAFELRVTVVGRRVFACAIHSQASEQTKIDWRRYDIPNTPHHAYSLDRATEQRCLTLTRALGLAFSAIDLVVCPDGRVVFLELNPNGQFGWIEELSGLPISRALADQLAGRAD